MVRRSSMVLINLFVSIAGILLIILHDNIRLMEGIAIIMGVLFLVPSCVSLVMMIVQNAKERNNDVGSSTAYSGILPSLGGLCFGLSMVIKPELYVGILVYLFAIILIIGGLYHVILMAVTSKQLKMPIWFYILPSLIAVAGFVILITDIRTIESVTTLITGIGLLCFSLTSVLEYFGERSVRNSRLMR